MKPEEMYPDDDFDEFVKEMEKWAAVQDLIDRMESKDE